MNKRIKIENSIRLPHSDIILEVGDFVEVLDCVEKIEEKTGSNIIHYYPNKKLNKQKKSNKFLREEINYREISTSLNVNPDVARQIEVLTSKPLRLGKEYEVMLKLNELLEGFGVEVLEGTFVDNYYSNFIASYINLGDAYINTILHISESGEFVISSYGDWLEMYEKENSYTENKNKDKLRKDFKERALKNKGRNMKRILENQKKKSEPYRVKTKTILENEQAKKKGYSIMTRDRKYSDFQHSGPTKFGSCLTENKN